MQPSASRLALVFSSVGHAYSHLFMLLYPTVVLALEPVFGLPYGELLSLSFVGYFLFGAAALPAGWLGDRWSANGMMAVFFLGTGAASILTGLARTPFEIGLGLAAIGLFASIYHPVGIAWLIRQAEHRGRAVGINGVAGSFGIAGAATVAAALTAWIDWRAAFVVPGIVSVATGLVFLLAMSGLSGARRAAARGPAEAAPTRRETVRAVAVLLVTFLCGGLLFQSATVALPKLFAERAGDIAGGVLGVGGLVTLVLLVAGAGQLTGGLLADRLPLKRVYLTAYVCLGPILALAAGLGGLTVVAVMMLAMTVHSTIIPVENILLSRYAPSAWQATAFGAKFVLSFGVSALGVPLVGFLHDLTGGFVVVLVTLGALAATAAMAIMFLPAGRPEPEPALAEPTPAAQATRKAA